MSPKSHMQIKPSIIDWLTRMWPAVLAVVGLVSGYVSLQNDVKLHTTRIEKLENNFEAAEKTRREDQESLKRSMEDIRLNLARICQKLGVSCRDN